VPEITNALFHNSAEPILSVGGILLRRQAKPVANSRQESMNAAFLPEKSLIAEMRFFETTIRRYSLPAHTKFQASSGCSDIQV